MKLLNLTKEERKIIRRASMAALAINPRNPRTESIKLLRELNVEMKKIFNSKT